MARAMCLYPKLPADRRLQKCIPTTASRNTGRAQSVLFEICRPCAPIMLMPDRTAQQTNGDLLKRENSKMGLLSVPIPLRLKTTRHDGRHRTGMVLDRVDALGCSTHQQHPPWP